MADQDLQQMVTTGADFPHELPAAFPADFGEPGGEADPIGCSNQPAGGPFVSDDPSTEATTFRAMATEKTWEPGTTLKVFFFSQPDAWSQEVVKAVQSIAPEWCDYANLKFDFVAQPPAHITVNVSFIVPNVAPRVPTYNCWHGTDCITEGIKKGLPSMNLLFQNGRRDEFRRVILHEVGHGLGLMHEHIRPDRPIRWNERAVIDSFKASQGWTEQMVRQQIIDFYQPNGPVTRLRGTAFDLKSIMMYPFSRLPNGQPMATFQDGSPFVTGMNSELTALDKVLISMVYPMSGVTNPPEVALVPGDPPVSGAIQTPGQVARYMFIPQVTTDHIIEVRGPMPALVALLRERGKPTGRTLAFESDGSTSAFTFRPTDANKDYFLEVRHAKPVKGTGNFSVAVRPKG